MCDILSLTTNYSCMSTLKFARESYPDVFFDERRIRVLQIFGCCFSKEEA